MIRLAVRVAAEQAELVLAELLELAPAGVEELAPAPGVVEYAVYGAPGELPALPDLHAMAGTAPIEVSTSEVPDDWHERWRQFHRPVLVEGRAGGPALRVRPPWEPALDADRALDLCVDPGQAFGTGAHASTRLCLELLLELTAADGAAHRVLDVGTGSGVLAIAALMLGHGPALGLDNEAESVAAAAENAARNGVALDVRRFDLRSDEPPWLAGAPASQGPPPVSEGPPPPDGPLLVLANLLRPLLLALAARVERAPAHLIASGLLESEVDEVVAAFAASCGLRECERRAEAGWAAVWLARPGRAPGRSRPTGRCVSPGSRSPRARLPGRRGRSRP